MNPRDFENIVIARLDIEAIYRAWWALVFSEAFTDEETLALVWWTLGYSLSDIAELTPRASQRTPGDGVTRERARQIQVASLKKADALTGGFVTLWRDALRGDKKRENKRSVRKEKDHAASDERYWASAAD